MKYIMQQIERVSAQEKSKGILTEQEILTNYDIMKDISLKEQLTVEQKRALLKKCWRTLDFLMSSLLLVKDFELLRESQDKKQENALKQLDEGKISKKQYDDIENEFIIKALIRCEKMYDAKQEIVRILVKIRKREQLMQQFEDEIDKFTDVRAKGYYYIILKLSTRIHN